MLVHVCDGVISHTVEVLGPTLGSVCFNELVRVTWAHEGEIDTRGLREMGTWGT